MSELGTIRGVIYAESRARRVSANVEVWVESVAVAVR